ncbi:helix-turn-helix transcriptional regulator [Verrucomicrobiaceae bacterium R5-34]|uniref:Helix-turn-helix transcriptional regulator n=1 Tax=Oceaniferula flava TaxID=2800421 RepID=A0AAE2VDT3_9BACT|nr:helix-turn-helix domain-containing protein [Oceaniferula flavus]MBK1831347.1 helix-turn-helix transcriptional regulator [Verrucomicrobiaceae bacterium R5-34]MBK1854984.1 helix-turn-helix transcriptional regulator [Oceaniferula flavus]MBM1136290.1 helix-turn-helix transcriptional regulator [Oceaniferula flavus]
MNIEETALCMAELGHKTRLAVFRHLVQAGKTGLPVGELQKQLEIPASTLSHHISRLTRAGLVVQERNGTTLTCLPQYQVLQEMIDFLVDQCCSGEPCLDTPCDC